jgi:aryl-alcohol dehydrogenase-like predicted oxidoreductase
MHAPAVPQEPRADARRLALGTVQLGLPYGVANQAGQVPVEEGARILALARSAGLDTVDTAIAYGTSEEVLGRLGVAGLRVVTKLPPLPADGLESHAAVLGWVRTQVQGSLARLGVPRLHGLLLHRSTDLCGRHGLALRAAFEALVGDGVAVRTGVSIYDPAELDALARSEAGLVGVSLVQAPFNVMDRRLVRSGWLARLHDAGAELHVRSAFLQGLLLMTPALRPPRFARWAPLFAQWDAALAALDRTALEACLGFVLAQRQVDRVVVGVDSATQLQEIVSATGRGTLVLPEALSSDDPLLINPSTWNTP